MEDPLLSAEQKTSKHPQMGTQQNKISFRVLTQTQTSNHTFGSLGQNHEHTVMAGDGSGPATTKGAQVLVVPDITHTAAGAGQARHIRELEGQRGVS